MLKKLILISIPLLVVVSLLICALLSSPSDVEADGHGYSFNVSEITNLYPSVRTPPQQSVVYAQNLYWFFYAPNNSHICYRTSADGVEWSEETVLDIETTTWAMGASFDLKVDESDRLHMPTTFFTSSGNLSYRCGQLNSDGTIDWVMSEFGREYQTIFDPPSGNVQDPSLILDSDGYPWVMSVWYDGTKVTRVWKSSTKDGTWTTEEYWDLQSGAVEMGRLLLLDSGKILALYTSYNKPIYGRIWDGDSWGEEQDYTQTNHINFFSSWSAVLLEDTLHLVYYNESDVMMYASGDPHSPGTWGEEEALYQAIERRTTPALSYYDDTLYLFWLNDSSNGNVMYMTKPLSDNWSAGVRVVYTEDVAFDPAINLSAVQSLDTLIEMPGWGGYLGGLYYQSGHSPSGLRFSYLIEYDWHNDNFSYRVPVLVNHSMVYENLENFPVLITNISSGCDNFWEVVKPDGRDIEAYDLNGTLLDSELVSICTSTKEMEYWVKLPHLFTEQDTKFLIYYGSDTYERENSDNTWDKHYLFVSHMGDYDPWGLTVYDSTKYHTSCTKSNSLFIVEEDCIIGTCQNFSNSESITCSHQVVYNTTNQTTEIWVKPLHNAGYTAEVPFARLWSWRMTHGANNIGYRDSSLVRHDGSWYGSGLGGILKLQWTYWVGGYNNSYIWNWINDSMSTIDFDPNEGQEDSTEDISIGNHLTQSYPGCVDEARYSNISRNESYLLTNYAMYLHPEWFVYFECEEDQPLYIPRRPTNFRAMLNTTDNCIYLNWTMGLNTTHTYIKASQAVCPSMITLGEFVVNTTEETAVFCAGNFELDEYCFSAWGVLGGTLSTGHACTCEGGEGMTLIATLFALIFLPVALTAFAFWQKKTWLYYGSAMAWVAMGVYGLTQYTSGDVLWVLGIVGMFMAFVMVVVTLGSSQGEQPDEEEEPGEEDYEAKLDGILSDARRTRRRAKGLGNYD